MVTNNYTLPQSRVVQFLRGKTDPLLGHIAPGTSVSVATEFGVMQVSRGEAIHAVSTCEEPFIHFSIGPGEFILEHTAKEP